MDVSGGGVVNGLLFSQTGDQMADITGIMVVNQNTEFIPADAVQFSVTGENFPENMCGIRNILIPTVMSEFIIVVFQVVQVKYKQQKICQFFAPAGIFVVSIRVVGGGVGVFITSRSGDPFPQVHGREPRDGRYRFPLGIRMRCRRQGLR